MSLVPNRIATQCPWGTDADEEVSLCLAEHEANEDEEQSHRGQHGCAHLEIGVSQVPGKRQAMHVQHERHDQDDEHIERIAELGDVRPERINGWKHEE